MIKAKNKNGKIKCILKLTTIDRLFSKTPSKIIGTISKIQTECTHYIGSTNTCINIRVGLYSKFKCQIKP